MQCGGSVNCPIGLQNTSLCGDRKVPRILSQWEHLIGAWVCLDAVSLSVLELQICNCKAMLRSCL